MLIVLIFTGVIFIIFLMLFVIIWSTLRIEICDLEINVGAAWYAARVAYHATPTK